jgi:hypothetical protein
MGQAMKAEYTKVTPITEPETSAIYNAKVSSVTDDSIVVDIAGIPYRAAIAFSCLVRPEPADVVMCAKDESGIYYILGVLARPGEQSMMIDLSADTTVRTRKGSLSVISGTSLNLFAGRKINCVSDQVIHKSREAMFDYEDVTAHGKNLNASFASISVLSDLMSSMARQVIDRFKSYIRHSEEFDQVKAGQMTREVKGMYSMDSRYTIMVSKKDTKIDGERIHMG